jgi:hypothetical protein
MAKQEEEEEERRTRRVELGKQFPSGSCSSSRRARAVLPHLPTSSPGQPYTPSLLGDSSETEPGAELLCKNSTDLDPSSNSMDAGSTHQLEKH